jgi:hypothetical protein
MARRVTLALVGAAAGMALYVLLVDLPDRTDNTRLVMTLASLVGGFFALLLPAIGPVTLGRAVIAAGLIAVASSGLLTWASFRFPDADDFLSVGHGLAAYTLLVALPLPFLIAALRPGEGWRDFPALFAHAWEIVVRYVVAWTFTGIVWGVIMLSDQVLQLVGIDLIERLIDIDGVPWALTGLALGLSLAVSFELRGLIRPDLVLRLLRLLLPVVLVVSAVFLIAAPINGLSRLFGGISAAATLMAMAIAAATLITVTLDRSDETAARARVLVWSARLTALILPVLGALAGWAVMVRVGQYGWTPARLAAAVAAAVTLAYGLAYAGAVLRGAAWQRHIRQANIWLALMLIATAALWLSPVLNAERISANSQIARYERGEVDATALDLWTLGHDWGRAGTKALDRLRGEADEALASRFAMLDAARSRFDYLASIAGEAIPEQAADLMTLLAVRPEGAILPEGLFDDDKPFTRFLVETLTEGCAQTTPGGAPGCVAVVADFMPLSPGDEVVFFSLVNGAVQVTADPGTAFLRSATSFAAHAFATQPDLIDRILAGDYTIDPVPLNMLVVDGNAAGVQP